MSTLFLKHYYCFLLPSVRPSLHLFRPSCPYELCPQDRTPPSLVRNKVCWSPQQMSVMTPGTDQDTGLRADCGPNCPLELSPQQYSCCACMSPPPVLGLMRRTPLSERCAVMLHSCVVGSIDITIGSTHSNHSFLGCATYCIWYFV